LPVPEIQLQSARPTRGRAREGSAAARKRHVAALALVGLVSQGAAYVTDEATLFLTGQGGLDIGRTYDQDTQWNRGNRKAGARPAAAIRRRSLLRPRIVFSVPAKFRLPANGEIQRDLVHTQNPV
jgi:hypothetical protein